MRRAAEALGLGYAASDPAYPGNSAFEYPFELFSRGIAQTCENVISGDVAGIRIVAFDFAYVLATGDYEHPGRSEPIRFTCAVASVAGHRPHVVIEPASSSLVARADGEPVTLEWGDFNRRYRVVSPERAFAAALLDVDLMAWLVDAAPDLELTWEVQRDRLLC